MVGHAPDAAAASRAVDPADALQVVARGQCRQALVDFDETLWLRSSTEAFLASARPRLLAFLVLTVLDVLRPWQLLPGARRVHVYRDWIRVLSICVALPWSLLLWRRQARALGARWVNTALLEALRTGGYGTVLVVTNGFRPIVAPLLRAVPLTTDLAVASDLRRGDRVRAAGKRRALAERGLHDLGDAVFVTDSADDADVLAACGRPLLVRWPEARYDRAFGDAYLPFLYTRRGKRAGQKYLLHNVVLEDMLMLCLALVWTVERPVLVALGIVLLHCSFWMVYEIGYHENDTHAVKRERSPDLPAGTAAYGHRMKPSSAWAWAAVVSLPGAWLLAQYAGEGLRIDGLLEPGWRTALAVYLLWLSYLCAARLAYWLYNRIEPSARVFPYAVLHLFRTLGYGLFLQPTLVGAVALASLVFGRWIPYIAYRDLGSHLLGSYRLINLFSAAVLLVAALTVDPEDVVGLQALVVLAWLTARAHRPLRELARVRRPPAVRRTSAGGQGHRDA